KPRPNLTLGLGFRVDQEVIDTFGREPVPVRAQAREELRRYTIACEAAGVLCTGSGNPGKVNGTLPAKIPAPDGSPLAAWDTEGDGFFETAPDYEGRAIFGLLTDPNSRIASNYTISNTNVAPRLSVSWDPWNDGRTRVSGSAGRYYDRLFLGEITIEQF